MTLEMDGEESRSVARAAADWVAAYYGSLRERPLVRHSTSRELRGMLDERLPREGCSFDELMGAVDQVVAGFSRHNGHPRFFGYVSSPGAEVATAAAMIAAALNINVTSWRSGPAAAEMELLTVRWMKE